MIIHKLITHTKYSVIVIQKGAKKEFREQKKNITYEFFS